ncbi:NAD(P)/FAD-dependent oxidoreductase [Anaerovorax odorimutans]|uniref:NAD(P)/FAD-dependent oxidoreductase n=1 Tax=Anaerovorax odorimutans TaxID=109327 RepID=UPI0004222D13|nr:NAD(P)/FAD-dependent oxidoreductase [Anaerovorax odorimutans]
MSEVLIIGNGPAGISAALYTARAGLKTTVIGKDTGALAKAEKIENYFGFEEPISGDKLISQGVAQAKRLGVEIINDEVVGLNYDGSFLVKTSKNQYSADSVILATGSSRTIPPIKGTSDYEGRGISYCAVCDAFFYRDQDVAVLGNSNYALSEAIELLPIVKSVTLITNGKSPVKNIPEGIKVITKEIASFEGEDELLSKVCFKDGSFINISGVFVAIGVAGSSDLAKKLGAETNGTKIVVDENMTTNIPGLFAAGDCTGGLLQISKAVYEGAKAGTETIKFIRENKK